MWPLRGSFQVLFPCAYFCWFFRGRVSSFSSSLVLGLERVMVTVGEDHGVVGDLVAKEGELIVDPL